MTVTQYIGNRYVPLFADPLDWDKTKEYEALTIVYYAGNSYTSRQAVPKNIDISDETYWALTGNYNAQIEAYRKEVKAYDARITANTERIEEVDSELAQSISDTADSITKGYKAADAAIEKAYKAVDTEIYEVLSDHETLIKNNASNLTTEVARAKKAEQANTSGIAAETKRATAAEDTLNQLLDNAAYLPIATDGWVSTCSEYYYTSASTQKPYIPQSIAIRDDIIYALILDYNSDNGNVYAMNRGTNAITTYATGVEMGHGQSFTYSPATDSFYILPCANQSNGTNATGTLSNVLIRYNSSFSTKTKITTPKTWGAICYNPDTKAPVLFAEDGTIYDLNESTNKFTIRSYSLTPSFTSLGMEAGQDGAIYDGLFYKAIGWNGLYDDNLIAVWDIETGKLVKTYLLPVVSDIFPTGEIEGIDFDASGAMYLANQNAWDTEHQNSILSILRSNIRSTSGVVGGVSGNFKTSQKSMGCSVNPSKNLEYKCTKDSGGTIGITFGSINEALSYASCHNTRFISLYPTYASDTPYGFHEFVITDGLDVAIIANKYSTNGYMVITGGVWARGNSRVNWQGELHVQSAKNLGTGSKLGVYLSNSIGIFDTYSLHVAYDTSYKNALRLEGNSIYLGSSTPYVGSGITVTKSIADESVSGGYIIGKIGS